LGKWSKEQKEAARQLLARRKARKNFWAFCQYMDADFFIDKPAPEHIDLPGIWHRKYLKKCAAALQQVERGKIEMLMMNMPTRAGKTYIMSMWTAWMFGRHNKGSIMRNSYGASLYRDYSHDTMNIIQDPKYVELFPETKLATSAVDGWRLETGNRVSFFGAGVCGPLAGKGCTLAAISDDLIKDFQESQSPTILNTAWMWKRSVHNRRKEGNCPEIYMGTMWSRKDPASQSIEVEGLLKDGGKWVRIKIAALDENDQSFCELVRTTEQYQEMRRTEDSVIWEAVSQQNPIEVKGLLYPAESLNYYKLSEVEKYSNLAYAESWDSTICYIDTADEGVDHLCSTIGNIKGTMVFIGPDIVHTQEPIEITEGKVASQLVDNNPDRIIVESNNGGKPFARKLNTLIKGRCRASARWIPNTQNKETRMIMKTGKVKEHFWFLAPSEYQQGSNYDIFMRHLTSTLKTMPVGKNQKDDAADNITGLAEMVDKKGLQFG